MNTNDSPGTHLDDETLSAALDKVDDSVDHVVAAHLAGCAECSHRSERLAAARAALAGAPVEPLDDLARRRLVARALAEASPALSATRQWYRHPALAGGIAAALLVGIAVTVPILRSGRPGRDTAATSSEAALLASAPYLGDLGDVSDPSVLRARLRADLESPSAYGTSGSASAGKSADNAAPGGSSAPAPALAPAAGGPGSPAPPAARTAAPSAPEAATDASRQDLHSQAQALDQTVTGQCTSTLARGPARGAHLVATGVATYRGDPVVAVAFATERGTTVYLAARDGCRVLASYPL